MVDDLLSSNNGLEAITKSVEARERRPQLIQAALESLQPDMFNLRLVQEATTGNNNSWVEATSSIIEQSEASTGAAWIWDWREDVEAGITSDSRGMYARSEAGKGLNEKPLADPDVSSPVLKSAKGNDTSLDTFTLRGTLTSLFFITTNSCPGFNRHDFCLG